MTDVVFNDVVGNLLRMWLTRCIASAALSSDSLIRACKIEFSSLLRYFDILTWGLNGISNFRDLEISKYIELIFQYFNIFYIDFSLEYPNIDGTCPNLNVKRFHDHGTVLNG